LWPFNKSKSSKKRTKTRFARSYTGAKASRLLADFLSPSSAKSLFLVSPDGAAYDGDDFEDYAPILDLEPGSIT